MRRAAVFVSVLAVASCARPAVRRAEAPRARVRGISHVAFYVSDLPRARRFYEDFLGLRALASAPDGEPGPGDRALVAVGRGQYLELLATAASGDRLAHVGLASEDLHGRTLVDPDGHELRFRSPAPHGAGSDPSAPFDTRIAHAGVLVGSLAVSLRFYRDAMGFGETWRGSAGGARLDWVNLRVPDGEDYLELMLYAELPPADQRGAKHHVCLFTPDVVRAVAALEARPARALYPRAIDVKVGKNRKRQANLFDPDGTRVELMEPTTVDGAPAPPSSAAPPRP